MTLHDANGKVLHVGDLVAPIPERVSALVKALLPEACFRDTGTVAEVTFRVRVMWAEGWAWFDADMLEIAQSRRLL